MKSIQKRTNVDADGGLTLDQHRANELCLLRKALLDQDFMSAQ